MAGSEIIHSRTFKKILAISAIAVASLGLGIWLNWPQERRPGHELLALLPPSEKIRQLTVEHSRDAGKKAFPTNKCAPALAFHQFRTSGHTASVTYGIGDRGDLKVSVVQMRRESVNKVHEALSSATHCSISFPDGPRRVSIKIARPWFGDTSALFNVTDIYQKTNVYGRPRLYEHLAFTASGEYLLMIEGNLTSAEEINDVYPQLVAGLDRELNTSFSEPNLSGGGCQPANLAVKNLPPNAKPLLQRIQTIHDLACKGDAEGVLSAAPPDLTSDTDFRSRVKTDPSYLAVLARTLEARGIYQDWAVIYRLPDSVVTFSTYDPVAWSSSNTSWETYVYQCSKSTDPAARRRCFGPPGGADWEAWISEQGCRVDMDNEIIEAVEFQDLTGDGYNEAVLVFKCYTNDGRYWLRVRVFDGQSSPDALPTQPPWVDFTDPNLNVADVELIAGTLTLTFWADAPHSPPITHRLQWKTDQFEFLPR